MSGAEVMKPADFEAEAAEAQRGEGGSELTGTPTDSVTARASPSRRAGGEGESFGLPRRPALEDWTRSEVSIWASDQLSLPPDVVQVLYEKKVDGLVLSTLLEDDLEELGVWQADFRRRIFCGVADLRSDSVLLLQGSPGRHDTSRLVSFVATPTGSLSLTLGMTDGPSVKSTSSPTMGSYVSLLPSMPVSHRATRPPAGMVQRLVNRIREKEDLVAAPDLEPLRCGIAEEDVDAEDQSSQGQFGARGGARGSAATAHRSVLSGRGGLSVPLGGQSAPVSVFESNEDDLFLFDMMNPFDLEDGIEEAPIVTVSSPPVAKKVAFKERLGSQLSDAASPMGSVGSQSWTLSSLMHGQPSRSSRRSGASDTQPEVDSQASEFWQDVDAPSARHRQSKLRLSLSSQRQRIRDDDAEWEAEECSSIDTSTFGDKGATSGTGSEVSREISQESRV